MNSQDLHVTTGVLAAIQEVEELSGRTILDGERHSPRRWDCLVQVKNEP